jgi:hypothetical protein
MRSLVKEWALELQCKLFDMNDSKPNFEFNVLELVLIEPAPSSTPHYVDISMPTG